MMIIGQYLGIFDPLPANLPLSVFTRLYLAFAMIVSSPHGDLNLTIPHESQVRDLIKQVRIQNPKAEIFLSIGDGDDGLINKSAYYPNFANIILKRLESLNLDGLDLDWEDDISERELQHIIVNWSSLLHSHNKKMTIATFPMAWEIYNTSIINKYLDQINVMSYGAEIDLEEVAKDFIRGGLYPSKILGGVSTEKSGDRDTMESIKQKVSVSKKLGLSGVYGWRLDNDYTVGGRPTYKGAERLWEYKN